MIDESRAPPTPYGVLLIVVVALLFLIPSIIGDQAEALTQFISDLLSPIGLLALPIALLLLIHFISSGHRSFVSAIFPTGRQDDIHRAGGSPFGVALVLVLVLFLLYNRFSIFGGEDDSGD